MARIKLVVFDMDGTLLKPRSCWAYIHEHFGTDNSEMLKKSCRAIAVNLQTFDTQVLDFNF